MVERIVKEDETYYRCEKCNMNYETKELARRCEKHCRDNNACDIEIIKEAVMLEEE